MAGTAGRGVERDHGGPEPTCRRHRHGMEDLGQRPGFRLERSCGGGGEVVSQVVLTSPVIRARGGDYAGALQATKDLGRHFAEVAASPPTFAANTVSNTSALLSGDPKAALEGVRSQRSQSLKVVEGLVLVEMATASGSGLAARTPALGQLGPEFRWTARLAEVLEGHPAGQGFTGVFNTATWEVLLKPSTSNLVVPEGWVRRGGGHAAVSRALGGDASSHVGFAAILEEGGGVRLTWRSGTLNPPPGLVPSAVRPAVVEAVEATTARSVTSY